MNRLHVHVGVRSLEVSIAFYSKLFGRAPTLVRADYAKWLLDDPRVNFAISSGHAAQGIEHLGIQADSREELAAVQARLKSAARPTLDEGATVCCYARSEKSWTSDPDGVLWEAFFTSGEATVYGDSPELTALSTNAGDAQCCEPRLASIVSNRGA